MCDGPAEADSRRSHRIDVDELVVVGRVGEIADAVLANVYPVGNADRLSDFCADIVECCDRHRSLS